MSLSVAVGVPSFGPAPGRLGPGWIAAAIEEAGFDGAWLTDHVVLIENPASRYPYAQEGGFFLPADGDWYESVVTLAHLAATTSRVELGIGVLVLPLRNPIVLAKQLATVDRLAAGRVRLAVGVGWLREEMQALGVDPRTRGARTDAGIELLRACWTGRPPAGLYGPFEVPDGVHCRPTPVAGTIPIDVGGHGDRARERVVATADGWFAAGSTANGPGPEDLGELIGQIREHAPDRRVTLRLAVSSGLLGSAELTDLLGRHAQQGVDVVVADFGWRSREDGVERLEQLRTSVQPLHTGA